MTTSGGEVLIGATSEVGRALARELARRGGRFVVSGRDADELNRIAEDLRIRGNAAVTPLVLDVADFEKHGDFFQSCVAALNSVEGLILCQGDMADQREAELEWPLTRTMIDVNYASAVSLGNLFAAHMAANGRGYICGVSSVAGDRGRQSNFLYGSTKAGLSAYLQGLRNRLYSKGVAVITIKPGFVDTSMTWGQVNVPSFLIARPERIARDIFRAICRRKNVQYTPWFWAYVMPLIRLIPEPLFKRLSL